MTNLTTSQLLAHVQQVAEMETEESQSVCAEYRKGKHTLTAYLSFEDKGMFWLEGLHHERELRTAGSILDEFPDRDLGYWVVRNEE